MSRLATSFILGFHGCEKSLADQCLIGKTTIEPSERDYDWLGPGAYFWEADPQRAMEWAKEGQARGKINEPAVLGAVIDLRNCLDLVSREDIELVRSAYGSYEQLRAKAGLPLASNKPIPNDSEGPSLLRFLDCAVLRHLHALIEDNPENGFDEYDTVRGMFVEGDEAFPGSGLSQKSHVQIAVRSPDCIRGYFLPLDHGQPKFL